MSDSRFAPTPAEPVTTTDVPAHEAPAPSHVPVTSEVPPHTTTHDNAVAPAPATELQPVDAAPAAAPVVAEPVSSSESAPTPDRVVYVEAPIPPKVRGNRVVGVLLAILGAVLFAVVYGGATALYALATLGTLTNEQVSGFLLSAGFWIPVMLFTLAFILLVVLLNRAGWWAHVLGSLVLAAVVYGGTIGLLTVAGSVTLFGAGNAATGLFFAPSVVLAGIVSREVAIWIGLAISARGRRVAAKNIEARRVFDAEQESKRAEYARATAA